jgi:lipopolysaccharide biosynthesis glycosyltransferase
MAPHCFIPNNKIYPTHIYEVDNFDYMFTAKYIINKWDRVSSYDNFLYLDVDAIPVKSLDLIFSTIQEQKFNIHCVKEKNSLNTSDLYHKFSNTSYDSNIPAFNSGTFGFNKECLEVFNEYISYTNAYRQYAIMDQSVFNEFFANKNLTLPTLSKFTYLYNDRDIYKDINQTTLREASVVHFLGNAFLGKNVQTMKEVLSNV